MHVERIDYKSAVDDAIDVYERKNEALITTRCVFGDSRMKIGVMMVGARMSREKERVKSDYCCDHI